MRSMKAGMAALVAVGCVSAASAAPMIGIDVGSDRENSGSGMAVADTAGVVPQTHWNNAPAAGTLAAGTVVDNSGAAVAGLSVTWSGAKANQTWSSGTSFTGGDGKLMTGWLDSGYSNFYDANNASVCFTNLPAAYTASGYDIYVYVRGAATAQLNPTSATADSGRFAFTAASGSTWLQATAAGGQANYVKFPNQTASSFRVTDWGAGLAGVQVVAIPEPALFGLAGGWAAVLLLRRRHAGRQV